MRANSSLCDRMIDWVERVAFNALVAAFVLVVSTGCMGMMLVVGAIVLCYMLGAILLSASVLAMAHEWNSQVPIGQMDPETLLSCLSWAVGWNLVGAAACFVTDVMLSRGKPSDDERLMELGFSDAPVRVHIAVMSGVVFRVFAPFGLHLVLTWVVPFVAGVSIAIASAR